MNAIGQSFAKHYSLVSALLYVAVTTVSAQVQSGSLDITFNPGTGPSGGGGIRCMALETNGQIVIGGDFTSFNGVQRSYVARINADGGLDPSFYPGVGPDESLYNLAVQTNGEIIISGEYSSINGVPWNQPARLRSDGSLDTSFDTSYADGGGTRGGQSTLALQADGKILIGGGTLSVNGNLYNGIVRLNTNATLDLTFDPGGGVTNGSVDAIGLQSTSRIIVGGTFKTFNTLSFNNVARLNSDGSVDSTFVNPSLQDGSIVALAITPQDQIVICGTFTSIGGYSRPGIARLNSNGSLDTTFNPGFGVTGAACLCVQDDGKVIIGGNFSYVNNTARNGIARLNADGSLDSNFNPGTGTTAYVRCVASQPDGKTLISGFFSSFNGTNINNIARLQGDNSLSTTPQFLAANLYFATWFYGVPSNTYRIEWTSALATQSLWTPLFDVTLQSNSTFVADPNPPTGQRFYRAVQIVP